MGSGKSTLAKAYAARHGGTVFDTDEEFTRRYGEITAFFEAFGEDAFRKLEAEIVGDAAKSDCDVIACGGGVVTNAYAMNALKAVCDIVYLRADVDTLEKRIRESDRPLKSRAAELFEKRKSLYERYADYTVGSDGDTNSSLDELERAIAAPRKNRYDAVFCDADDTVLDFRAAMRFTIVKTARDMNVTAPDGDIISAYEKILPEVWGKLERGEITREMLAGMRFNMLKLALKESFDADEFNSRYMQNIKTTRFVIDGALEFLDKVRARGIAVYIITNSYRAVAEQRLKALDGHIDGAFVSEDIGFDKPDARFFEWVRESTGNIPKSRILVFGDGVYPDIHGGKAFGADTCLFDRKNVKQTSEADFVARTYADVLRIL